MDCLVALALASAWLLPAARASDDIATDALAVTQSTSTSTSKSTSTSPARLTFELAVAPGIDADFVLFDRGRYGEDELGSLFEGLRTEGDAYCAMLRTTQARGAGHDPKVATRMIAPTALSGYRGHCRGCEWQVRAGCWNFFTMNDLRPDDDFALVKKLYAEAPGFDCYSVGQVQPYMMHNVLGCVSLTMIDFDWRIHDVHMQFIRAYREGRMGSAADVAAALKTVQIGWPAFSATPQPTRPGSLDLFCPAVLRDRCVDHLVRFSSTSATIDNLRLNVAALHETTYADVPAEIPRVYFLSNALEPIYTQKHEFDRFLADLVAHLKPEQKAVLIHHVGSYSKFGLYEVSARDGKAVVRTLCRDQYNATAVGHINPFYSIYLDALAVPRGPRAPVPPTCAALQRRP
jgi:hypothetical protein